MLENLHLETFSQHLNSNFTVKRGSGDPVELQLIETNVIGSTPGYEQFSLIFRGPLDNFLQQSIYSFEHAEIEPFEMFIVPIRQQPDGFLYEAIVIRQL